MNTRWVDVSHEALIRGWPRLRQWIEEDRSGLREQRRVTEAAQEWEKLRRDESALYRGTRLAQATEWRERSEDSLNDTERAFLDASSALQQREVRERERLRRRVIVGLSVALGVTSILVGFAAWQWRQAYVQGQVALARQLVAQANLLKDNAVSTVLRAQLTTDAARRLAAVGEHSFDVDLELRRALVTLPRHVATFDLDELADEVQLSADGRLLFAVGDSGAGARAWDLDTGTLLLDLKKTNQGLVVVKSATQIPIPVPFDSRVGTLSADGRYLVTRQDDGSQIDARLWDLQNMSESLRVHLEGSQGKYYLSRDATVFAVTEVHNDTARPGATTTVTHVWHTANPTELGQIPGELAAFSADTGLLIGRDAVWQVKNGDRPAMLPILTLSRETFEDAAVSPGGTYLAARLKVPGSDSVQYDVYSLAQHTRVGVFSAPFGLLEGLSEDGRRVALVNDDSRVLEVLDTTRYTSVVGYTALLARAVSMRAGRPPLMVTNIGNQISTWEIMPGGSDFRRFDHTASVQAVAFGPDSTLMTLTASATQLALHTWNIAAASEGKSLLLGRGNATAATLSADARYAAFQIGNTVAVWSTLERRKIATFATTPKAVLALSSDGRYLAAAADQQAQLWSVAENRPVGKWAYENTAISIAISPDGAQLVAIAAGEPTRSGVKYTAYLWNPRDDTSKAKVIPLKDAVFENCPLTQDAKYVVTGGGIVELPSGRALAPIEYARQACALSADGRNIAIVHSSGALSVHELATNHESVRFEAREGIAMPRRIVYGTDDRYLATIAGDNAVSVWILRPDELLAESCKRLPPSLASNGYLSSVDYAKTCSPRS